MISRLFLTLLLATSAAAQQEPAVVSFSAQTRLVLLSFHVRQGKNFVPDLNAGDVTLFEDGKPRSFTIFDSPATQTRMPLELVLLFDVNPAIPYFWDPADVFRFIPHWEEGMIRQLLEKQDADVRICVYTTTGQKLYRLTGATRDARVVTRDFRGLLNGNFVTEAGADIPMTLPPKRDTVGYGPFTQDYQTSYFLSNEHRGWPMEAAISVLNDVAAAQDKVSRVMVMFSEGIGATTTLPEDIGVHALDLGIPIYPVATNYQHHIHSAYPRNLWRMQQFEGLGKLTGGRSVEYASIDAPLLVKILDSFKADALAQYVIGFVPDSNASPKRHNLEVRVAKKSSGSLEGGKRRAVY
ncbi:exported hypothetical protein [Candidatus Sulfopaludibacter sp. SbA3]|nr:exported hypothetical protein [Candidatus Sulfopaludibacter sp. SbA3]